MEERIAHYRIVSELGRGGMGVVYKAYEESLNRHVALKVLGSHLAEDPSFVQRFVREAQSAAGLNHPNIVQIHAIGEENGRHYFAMEYVSGTNLRELISRHGRFATGEAERIILQAAAGLQAAHERGIIHRDIKPANLMIDHRGLVKIADFGLALPMESAARLTATGKMLGSPGYLSPEQCRGDAVDHRTDIYSLGVTLFEALTGKIPFEADSPLALIRKIVDVEPPDVRELNPDVDDAARVILERMMAKDADRRYATCADLIAALELDLAARAVPSAASSASSPAATAPSTRGPGGLPELDTEPTVVVPSGIGEDRPITEARAGRPAPAVVPAEVTPPRGSRRTLAWVAAALVVLAVIVLAAGAVAIAKSGLVGRLAAARAARAAVAGQPETQPPSTAASGGEEPTPVAVGEPTVTVGTSATDSGQGSPSAAVDEAPSLPVTAPEDQAPRRDSPAPSQLTAPQRDLGAGESAPAQPEAPSASTGVVVVAVGETLLAGQAEAYLEGALGRAGAGLVDERSLPEVVDLLADGGPPERGAVREALRTHARFLVLVRAEYLGDRQIYYMGRPDVVYQARISATAVDLADGRRTGQPLNERVDYTQLTVERVVRDTLGPWIRSLRSSIQ